jgi:regulator of sigma E protease
MLTTVLAFLVTVGVLIAVHEWGHFQVARWCGVRVLRFSIGFGPVIWRRQAGPEATEYALSAIPLGGYVKMLDAREGDVPAALMGETFNHKPLWQRSAIVAAGPIANLVLAVLLYAASHWIGVQEVKPLLAAPAPGSLMERAGLRSGDLVAAAAIDEALWREVASLSDLYWQVMQAATHRQTLRLQLTDDEGRGAREVTLALNDPDIEVDDKLFGRLGFAGPYTSAVIGDVVANGPAEVAGLRKGDRVVSADGRAVIDGPQLRRLIRESAQRPEAMLALRVERAGQLIDVSVTPRRVQDAGREVGRIDAVVGTPPALVTVQQGPIDGLLRGAERTWEVSWLTLKMFGRMITGEASLKNISGPLTIADVAGQSANRGLAYYLGFLALVSVGLGVLNLLPVPMLDGGHLMYHLFEAITGRPPSDIWLERLQRVGAFVLFLLIGVALHNDVLRLLG